VDEMGEFRRIAEEKDWSVVEHPIEVSFFGFDFDRKTLHILEKRRHQRIVIVSQGMSRECFTVDLRTRGSRAESADPDSPPTVEKRTVKGALVPTFWNTCAEVMSESEWVNSKYP